MASPPKSLEYDTITQCCTPSGASLTGLMGALALVLALLPLLAVDASLGCTMIPDLADVIEYKVRLRCAGYKRVNIGQCEQTRCRQWVTITFSAWKPKLQTILTCNQAIHSKKRRRKTNQGACGQSRWEWAIRQSWLSEADWVAGWEERMSAD